MTSSFVDNGVVTRPFSLAAFPEAHRSALGTTRVAPRRVPLYFSSFFPFFLNRLFTDARLAFADNSLVLLNATVLPTSTAKSTGFRGLHECNPSGVSRSLRMRRAGSARATELSRARNSARPDLLSRIPREQCRGTRRASSYKCLATPGPSHETR